MSRFDWEEVGRVRRMIQNTEQLMIELKRFVAEAPEGAYHIDALRVALTTTIIHLHELRSSGLDYYPSERLVNLWWHAADALWAHDEALAAACREKAFGWADRQYWAIAKREGRKISINDMRDALKKLIGDHEASLQEARALAISEQPEMSDLTRFIPIWLLDERKQKAVAFVAVGFAAVVTAAWAVFVFVNDKDSKAADAKTKTTSPPITINNTNTNNNTVSPTISPTIAPQMNQNVIVTTPAPSPPSDTRGAEVKFRVCVGEKVERCPKNVRHIGCTDYAAYAKTECDRFSAVAVDKATAGNKCGYVTYEITCTVKTSAK